MHKRGYGGPGRAARSSGGWRLILRAAGPAASTVGSRVSHPAAHLATYPLTHLAAFSFSNDSVTYVIKVR